MEMKLITVHLSRIHLNLGEVVDVETDWSVVDGGCNWWCS